MWLGCVLAWLAPSCYGAWAVVEGVHACGDEALAEVEGFFGGDVEVGVCAEVFVL